MPLYNEGDGISEFLSEIHDQFANFDITYFLVDDASTDDSPSVLLKLAKEYPISFVRNRTNLGHGPSTVRALNLGLNSGIRDILSVDGDGQFYASEMLDFVVTNIQGGFDVGIGARIRSDEPLYRRFASKVTRLLVGIKVNKIVIDANTPLRFYRSESLEQILRNIDVKNPIPNLFLLVETYRKELNVNTSQLVFRDRRGLSSESTTWGGSNFKIPPKRFIKFCFLSFWYWLTH